MWKEIVLLHSGKCRYLFLDEITTYDWVIVHTNHLSVDNRCFRYALSFELLLCMRENFRFIARGSELDVDSTI